MSLKNIETLSLNPHFFKHMIICFLSGYGKPCDLKLIFMVLPILLYAPSRKKLASAKSTSRLESLFRAQVEVDGKIKLSGKTRLSGFMSRYKMLQPATKKTIIILHNQGLISINGRYIVTNKTVSYKDYSIFISSWMKAAYYLGVVFSKSTEDHITYFLGVE
ncbi:three component ABC system middle component [Oscillibacter sp.]|uniref:three component ABC system middle component n=1 Tax=Oscillibacter sp. TaxID=1945593 RepID=UPI0033989147